SIISDDLRDFLNLPGLDKASIMYGMVTKLVTNKDEPIRTKSQGSGHKLETLNPFKCLGAVISEEGSPLARLKPIMKITT
ncbi:hypothetical protein ElyMa_003343400, partial [Elysia marginata]